MQLTSLDQINQNYRHIYFQPHFDDAALSCGGAIAMQVATGQHVLIVTVFGGIPAADAKLSQYAMQVQQKMGLGVDGAEAVHRRRAEDEAAAGILGADVLWLDYLDAIYRGTPAYYQGEESLFGSVNAGDLSLDEDLASVFMNIHERAPLAALYAPLGIGHHVDHQLCCSAADRLAQRKLNVKFYEDSLMWRNPLARWRRASRSLASRWSRNWWRFPASARAKKRRSPNIPARCRNSLATRSVCIKCLSAIAARCAGPIRGFKSNGTGAGKPA